MHPHPPFGHPLPRRAREALHRLLAASLATSGQIGKASCPSPFQPVTRRSGPFTPGFGHLPRKLGALSLELGPFSLKFGPLTLEFRPFTLESGRLTHELGRSPRESEALTLESEALTRESNVQTRESKDQTSGGKLEFWMETTQTHGKRLETEGAPLHRSGNRDRYPVRPF